MTRGAFYLASGLPWAQEAVESAKSLKTYMPNLPVTLYTDVDAVERGPFDDVRKVGPLTPGKRANGQRIEAAYHRIPLMMQVPYYSEILRLDTDMHVLGDLTPLFDLLERFDVVVAHASYRFTLPLEDVPDSFPEPHAGMIAYRQSAIVHDFVKAWARKYWDLVTWAEGVGRDRLPPGICPYHADQAAMRWALYYSDVRMATVTPEWDCCPHAGFAQGEIKLLHARGERLERAKQLNQELESRVYIDGQIVRRP